MLVWREGGPAFRPRGASSAAARFDADASVDVLVDDGLPTLGGYVFIADAN